MNRRPHARVLAARSALILLAASLLSCGDVHVHESQESDSHNSATADVPYARDGDADAPPVDAITPSDTDASETTVAVDDVPTAPTDVIADSGSPPETADGSGQDIASEEASTPGPDSTSEPETLPPADDIQQPDADVGLPADLPVVSDTPSPADAVSEPDAEATQDTMTQAETDVSAGETGPTPADSGGDADAPADAACQPACDGKDCGPDGCGGTCGSCDDGNPCTTDACPPEQVCAHQPAVGLCDDGDPCTLVDQCVGGACEPGAPPPCDGACQTGACEADGDGGFVCAPKPNGESCDDGLFCSTGDSCQAGICVAGAPPPCSGPCLTGACEEGGGAHVCTPKPDGESCDDGSGCTVDDLCQAGVCDSGPPLPCDDGEVCTVDYCEEASGACVNDPAPLNGGACDDQDTCTVADSCVDGACVGAPCSPALQAVGDVGSFEASAAGSQNIAGFNEDPDNLSWTVALSGNDNWTIDASTQGITMRAWSGTHLTLTSSGSPMPVDLFGSGGVLTLTGSFALAGGSLRWGLSDGASEVWLVERTGATTADYELTLAVDPTSLKATASVDGACESGEISLASLEGHHYLVIQTEFASSSSQVTLETLQEATTCTPPCASGCAEGGCPDGEVLSCSGQLCVPLGALGDGVCDPQLACASYDYDGCDCDCDP